MVSMSRRLLSGIAAFAFITVAAHGASKPPSDISGQAQVIDGDSLYVGARELRLTGIDAPEWKQVCKRNGKDWYAGRDAKRAVASLLADRTVICEDTKARSYRRVIGRCFLDGQDLGELIVGLGWAYDYPKYSDGRYQASEAEARASGRGVWRGECQRPWDWRRENPR